MYASHACVPQSCRRRLAQTAEKLMQPPPCVPRPAELVKQVIGAAETAGVQLLAENALEGGIYNAEALQRMLRNSKHFQRCAPPHDVRPQALPVQ